MREVAGKLIDQGMGASREVCRPQSQFRAGGGEQRKGSRRQCSAWVGAAQPQGCGSHPADTVHCWPRGNGPSRWEARAQLVQGPQAGLGCLRTEGEASWGEGEARRRGSLGFSLRVTEPLKDSGLEETGLLSSHAGRGLKGSEGGGR